MMAYHFSHHTAGEVTSSLSWVSSRVSRRRTRGRRRSGNSRGCMCRSPSIGRNQPDESADRQRPKIVATVGVVHPALAGGGPRHALNPLHSPAPAPGDSSRLFVPVSYWGEGEDGIYASSLTQWDLAHWERKGAWWLVAWEAPEASCCCVELGRSMVRGMRKAKACVEAAAEDVGRRLKSLLH
ncbi:unnamed protein product [Vitrella brassicaformis CCMP3155]|uniref:Uncharacterized protein n=1 Tax=Vitrella brassicaformis (strain CCMP3155) TaxID=1169540 RepID=A0A0G4GVW4_VITBC|nr:unnamed protein product [Vitrella brassicaformis CCMP3155]|eukprot:CEM35098.1 unnamed protein product [Vitrella brassicaformis CCMP3155]